MASLSGMFGLKAGSNDGNFAPYHNIFNFFFSYVFLSSRFVKLYLKIDHNVNPRDDVAKYGERAVKEGKITQRQLDLVKRIEACHANSMEHFTVFTAASLFATVAGVSNEKINGACAVYSVSRIVFALVYLVVEKSLPLSFIRTVAWWSSSIACLYMFFLAGSALNA